MASMYTFPELIKQIRKESGLTQKEFAQVVSVSTILVSMIEAGQKDVSKNFILKLSEKLNVHPSTITPFLFSDQGMDAKSVSGFEKRLVDFGEKLQSYLIKIKSKNLKKYAN